MSERPTTSEVACPTCSATTFAVIPSNSRPVGNEQTSGDDYDGKVWTTCSSCDNRFLVYYRTTS